MAHKFIFSEFILIKVKKNPVLLHFRPVQSCKNCIRIFFINFAKTLFTLSFRLTDPFLCHSIETRAFCWIVFFVPCPGIPPANVVIHCIANNFFRQQVKISRNYGDQNTKIIFDVEL